jgi:hypothetical protein
VGGRRRLLCSACFVLPALLYLYTWAIDRSAAPLNWLDNYGRDVIRLHGYSLDSDAGFLTRLRYYFGEGRVETDWPTPVEAVRSLIELIRNLGATQFPLVGAVLAPVGLVALWRRDRRAATLLIAVLLMHAALFCAIATTTIGDAPAYSIPAFAAFAILIAEGIRILRVRFRATVAVAAGLLVVCAPILRYAGSSPLSHTLRPGAPAVASNGLRAEFVNLRENNDRGELYGVAVAQSVEPGSVVFARWSETHVLLYHQLVRGRLPGVDIRFCPPDPQNVSTLVDSLQPKSVYLTFPPDTRGMSDFHVTATIDLTPNHHLYRVQPRRVSQRTYGSDSRRRVVVSPDSMRSSSARTSGGG